MNPGASGPTRAGCLMATLLPFLLLAHPLAKTGETAPSVDALLHDHAEAMPVCPTNTQHCLGVRIFVAPHEGKPVVDPQWISAQFERANLLLEPLGVCLQPYSMEMLPKSFYHLKGRSDRDRLGATRWQRGFVHLFIAGKVNNVDEPGEIYGVHWRWRKNTSRRWVILSAVSWPMTLAHELGHFFGLPHNDIIGSIMNKAGNDPTPISDRRFTTDETATMK